MSSLKNASCSVHFIFASLSSHLSSYSQVWLCWWSQRVATWSGLVPSLQQQLSLSPDHCFYNQALNFFSHFSPFPPRLSLLSHDNANNSTASAPLPTSPSHPHHHLRHLPEPLREILPDAPGTPSLGAARVRQIRSGARP